MDEKEWQIDYNGWLIKVMANGFPQAKYRAWKEFKSRFDIPFRQFLLSARLW